MYKDIKNWRDLTDDELLKVFATYMAVNCEAETIPRFVAKAAYTCFEAFIERFSDAEKAKEALKIAELIAVDPKEFLS